MNDTNERKTVYSNEHNEDIFTIIQVPKIKALMSIGDYVNTDERWLHLFVLRTFGNRKRCNLKISRQEVKCSILAYHRWIHLNELFQMVHQ